MLSAGVRNTWAKFYRQSIDALGVPATVHPTDGPVANCTIGFKTSSDVDIINAWGVGSKVLTIQTLDVPVLKKLDRVVVEGERYTLDSVTPIHLNNMHIAWRCIVRGQ